MVVPTPGPTLTSLNSWNAGGPDPPYLVCPHVPHEANAVIATADQVVWAEEGDSTDAAGMQLRQLSLWEDSRIALSYLAIGLTVSSPTHSRAPPQPVPPPPPYTHLLQGTTHDAGQHDASHVGCPGHCHLPAHGRHGEAKGTPPVAAP